MAPPLVSVVVSGYNHEQFIVEALRSVEEQTYSKLEIIFVDGGSTDRTAEFARAFLAKSRHRVRIAVQKSNEGMLKDRALGYSMATGAYVCFFDSDDLMLPHKTAHQVDVLESTGAEAVFGSHDYLNEDGRTTSPRPPPLPAAWDAERFVNDLVLLGWPYAQSGLFRKDALDRIGGPDQGLPMNDWPFMIRLARTARRIVAEPYPVFLYRKSLSTHSRLRVRELLDWKLATFAKLLDGPLATAAEARAYRVAADFAGQQGDGRAARSFDREARRRDPQSGGRGPAVRRPRGAGRTRPAGAPAPALRAHDRRVAALALAERPLRWLSRGLLDRAIPWLRSRYVSLRYVDESTTFPSIRFVGRHSRLHILKRPGARLVLHSPIEVDYRHPGRQAASSLTLLAGSRMVVDRPFHIGEDVRVLLGPGAVLEVAVRGPHPEPISYSGFMGRCIVQVKDHCVIGANTGLSWGGEIMDSDWHPVDGRIDAQPIHVGRHVWIAPGCKILKGAHVGDDCIIARNSVVLGGAYPAKTFIAGTPATARGPARTWRYEWSAADSLPPRPPTEG
jgi:alpha-1,3-rhamnosyltransferase